MYGGVRATSGSFSSRHGYTGEYTDAETGLVHLRARQYGPTTGRFLSRDTVSPNAPWTQAFHPYAYAANNPTTWTDPSGHALPLIFTPVGVGIAAVLTAIWAAKALLEWQEVNGYEITGELELCGEDSICGEVLERVRTGLEVANHPVQEVRELVRAIFVAIPAAFFAYMYQMAVMTVTAIKECVANGNCTPKRGRREKDDYCLRNFTPPGPYTRLPPYPLTGPGLPFATKQKTDVIRDNWERHGSRTTGNGYWVLRPCVASKTTIRG